MINPLDTISILLGDCLQQLDNVPDSSVDMIATDLPYGNKITDCGWDILIPFKPLWEQYRRIIKPHGAIVLNATGLFTAQLILSHVKGFKLAWVWDKAQSGSFQTAKYRPLQITEDVLIFTRDGERVNYHPIMRKGIMRRKGGQKALERNQVAAAQRGGTPVKLSDEYYPVNVVRIPNTRIGNIHPTQKPVALFEYFIQTYSQPGDLVLDSCFGSGSSGVAAIRLGRRYIGIERDSHYYQLGGDRIYRELDTIERQKAA